MKIVPIYRVTVGASRFNGHEISVDKTLAKSEDIMQATSSATEKKKIEKFDDRLDLESLKRSDLNSDGIIDDYDLLEFLFNFPKGSDINADGNIDDKDLATLLSFFGKKYDL